VSDLTALRPGSVVTISIEGATVVAVDGNELTYTTLAGGEPVEHRLHIGKGLDSHHVDLLAEPEWSRLAPGDIWRSGFTDGLYAVAVHRGDGVCPAHAGLWLVPVSTPGEALTPAAFLRDHAPARRVAAVQEAADGRARR